MVMTRYLSSVQYICVLEFMNHNRFTGCSWHVLCKFSCCLEWNILLKTFSQIC